MCCPRDYADSNYTADIYSYKYDTYFPAKNVNVLHFMTNFRGKRSKMCQSIQYSSLAFVAL